MIRTALRLFLCAFVLSAAVFAEAATTFYGTTSGQPVFNRPDDLSTLSGVFTHYSVQPFFPNDDADCFIEGIQEGGFDGLIFLYDGSFDPLDPISNLIALDDDGPNYGVGESHIDSLALLLSHDYYLVTGGYTSLHVGTFSNMVACEAPATRVIVGDGGFGLGNYDGRIAELLGGRFQVSVTGHDFASAPFIGRTVPLASTDSAIFWFFEPANFELLLKMVDACSFNNRFWVFYAATTNVYFRVTVYDNDTGQTRTYTNPLGTSLFTAVTDSDAFPCP